MAGGWRWQGRHPRIPRGRPPRSFLKWCQSRQSSAPRTLSCPCLPRQLLNTGVLLGTRLWPYSPECWIPAVDTLPEEIRTYSHLDIIGEVELEVVHKAAASWSDHEGELITVNYDHKVTYPENPFLGLILWEDGKMFLSPSVLHFLLEELLCVAAHLSYPAQLGPVFCKKVRQVLNLAWFSHGSF